VPVSSRVLAQHMAWEDWAKGLAKRKPCVLHHHPDAVQRQSLQEAEDACRLYSAYAWLAYRLPEYFPSIELAQQLAREASERVDEILQAQNSALRKRRGRH
jgi:ATP-dependent RNA helicase SUPV3L1/SUV3